MQLEGSLEAEKKKQSEEAMAAITTSITKKGWYIDRDRVWRMVRNEFEKATLRLNVKENPLLWFLLLGDLLFILLYVVHRLDFHFWHTSLVLLKDTRLDIMTDWGFGEIYQYCKELACVVFLLGMGMRRRQWGSYVWALLFFYLFLDDSIYIHEKIGAMLTTFWALRQVSGMTVDGLGQAMVSAMVGLPFVFALLLAHLRGNQEFRAFSWQMGFVLVAIAFCGVALDIINIENQPLFVRGIVTIFEDGGEMLVMSVAVAVAYGWQQNDPSL